MIKTLFHWGIGFPKRAYTIMELRTGFATGLPILSSSLFAATIHHSLNWFTLTLFFISGFSFNIVANVANEIRAYLKNEENEDTFTEHLGSEGLVRGDATFLDACLVLLAWLGLAGLSGLMLVFITKSFLLFLFGCTGLIGSLTYSLGPKPYLLYPYSELISGILVGFLSSLIAYWLQAGHISLFAFAYAWICMTLTVFLMSTNNTGDFEKDKDSRTTLPHVIGFRRSILIIIPEFCSLLIAWLYLSITILPWWQSLIGLFLFYYDGYFRWLKSYLKIKTVYPSMGKEFGPRPLLLIRSFHLTMSICYLFIYYY